MPEAVPREISLVILTLNEEANLPVCLESVRDLRCELFIVDSGSTDRTLQIASASDAVVRQHPFENYAAQRNWALDNLPITTPWILNLDADERLTPELVGEINHAVGSTAEGICGFLLRQRTVFLGRWIRHGGHYPAYHLRLFRRGMGRCETRLYDQHFVVSGPVGRLKHDYIDVVASSLSTWSIRHAKWAAMEARELQTPGSVEHQVTPRALGNPIERRRWWRNTYASGPLFFRAFAYWCYRYFFRLGFLDGKQGLVFHFLQGFWFRFLVDALIDEERTRARGAGRQSEALDIPAMSNPSADGMK